MIGEFLHIKDNDVSLFKKNIDLIEVIYFLGNL